MKKNTILIPALLIFGWASFSVPEANAQLLNKLYIMDNNQDNEQLYIVAFDNPLNVVGSNVSVGSSIGMDSQLSADFRDIHVLSNGSLVVESVSANRLSYWNSTGTYDSGAGQFGGGTSNGLTPLRNSTFLSKDTGSTNAYKVFADGATTESYSGQLFESDGTTAVTSQISRLAPTATGGFVVGAPGNPVGPGANVFASSGDALNTTLTANTTANVTPNPGDTGPMAQFGGGWATRGTGATWYAFSETLNVGGDFPGVTVNGTVGGRIVDIASFGEAYTAALFMDTSFANTTSRNSYIQLWENADLAGGPVRTINLGFNLNTASQNWNNSKLAGPMVIPEPQTAALVVLTLGWLAWARRRKRANS